MSALHLTDQYEKIFRSRASKWRQIGPVSIQPTRFWRKGMEGLGAGAGLAALGFWLFVASVIAVGVWDNIRKRESQHETLRRVVESGQPIDENLTDKLLSITSGVASKDLERDLKVSGLIVLAIAPGMILMGWLMSIGLAEELFYIMAGVSALMVCLGGGLYGTAIAVGRWFRDENDARPPV